MLPSITLTFREGTDVPSWCRDISRPQLANPRHLIERAIIIENPIPFMLRDRVSLIAFAAMVAIVMSAAA